MLKDKLKLELAKKIYATQKPTLVRVFKPNSSESLRSFLLLEHWLYNCNRPR
jgi:hypothetical protein